MQARRIARELVLLGLSQLSNKPSQQQPQQLQDLMGAAVRTLTAEVRDTLEVAASELERGSDRLLSSEVRAADILSARAMVQEAIELAQTAINRMGGSVDLPEFIQMANQQAVRDHGFELLNCIQNNRTEIDQLLEASMVDWQLSRLARVDQDILRVAVAEMQYLGTPDRVAINEAIEMAKRYSNDDGYRFINGVLRRVTDRLKAAALAPKE